MTFQDNITANAAPDVQDQGQPSVVQRIAAIHQQGGSFIDPALQATLANSDQSTQGVGATVHAIAQTVGSDVGNLVSSVRTVFEDPVLYKQPTAALRLHQILTQQMGWAPVEQVDLHKVQAQLQKMGYAKGLAVSGVWTSDWQDAFHQASVDHMQAQRSSNEGKGFNFEHALGGFLGSFAPSHAVPALVGWAKNLPEDVRKIAADTVGGGAQAFSDLFHGDFKGAGEVAGLANPATAIQQTMAQKPGSTEASVGSFIEGTTPGQFSVEHGWQRAVNNVNTLLSIIPVMRMGGTVAEAGGQAIARGLFKDMGAQAAQRGPGVISNMLYRPAGVYADGAKVNEGGLLAAKALDHLPYLKQMMPGIRTGVENGQRWWYYTARPFVAAPYRLPIVAAAGSSANTVMLTGALLRGDANAVNHIEGGNYDLAKSIAREHPYTGPVGMALDLLGGMAHGQIENRLPLAATSAEEAAKLKPNVVPTFGVNPSQQVGDIVRNAMRTYSASLGDPGIIGAFERGTNLKYTDLLSDFEKAGLGKHDLDWTIQSKVDQLAAAHGADQEMLASAERGIPREDQWKTIANQIRQDPERLSKYRGELVDSEVALANRFAKDHNAIIQSPKAAAGSMVAEAKARRVAYQLINDPNLAWQNVHPGTFQALKAAQEEHAFSAAMGDTSEGTKPALTAGWLNANNPAGEPASLGIKRMDGYLRGQVLGKAAQFDRLLKKARTVVGDTEGIAEGQDSAAVARIRKDMGNLLLELGVHPNSVPGDTDGMLAMLKERANALAEKVAEPLNPTPEYTAARRQLNDLGYELVHGTGIGHEFAPPVIDPVVVDGGIRKARKVADSLGLSPTYATAMEAAQWRQLATIRAWQKLVNDGKIALPPGWTPSTLYRHAYDNIPSKTRLTGAEGAVFKLAERVKWRKMLAKQNPGATSAELDEKMAQVEKQLAEQRSLLDLAPKQFVEAMTARPAGGLTNELRGAAADTPLVDEATARRLYTSMVGSIKGSPKFIFGGSHIDDLIRAGGASFGNGAVANRKVLSRLALAGNNYTRFRNTYRFAIDPVFSARRIFKSYLKLLTVGVPASVHLPYEAMMRQGTLNEDLAYADKLFPETRGVAEGYDNLDRAIYQADIMGLYNPRHFYAYAAGWLKRQGLSDAEVKDKVTKALTYGSRSALERTVGTVFYPFSFEKTLYRQIGARLLDEPGQRFMLAAGLDAYHSLNHNDRLGHFVDRHLPVLTELQKLNAFSHGVGPGQLGGINAPVATAVWNAFRPQLADKPTNHYYDTLTAAIPAFSELNSLLVGYSPTTHEAHGGTLTQQLGITWQEAQNRVDGLHHFVFGGKNNPWNPAAPAETYQAQQDDAWALRNHLILQYASVIDYNYHHRGAEATFPTDGSVPSWLAGKTVTKSALDEIVHHFYPAFDATKAQTVAVANKIAVDRFVTQMKATNPDRGAAYDNFRQQADKFISYKNQAELDPAQWQTLAGLTEQFRAYAVALSEQDPTFKKFFDRYYTSQLGPLEALIS